jgi:hypothetical protein
MKSDECFTNLQVKNKLVVDTIYAKTIKLEDDTFKSNSNLLGADIKRLYESQKNTNAFTDEMVSILKRIESALTFSGDIPIFKLPNSDEISNIILKPYNYLIYTENSKLICRANLNDHIQDYFFKTYFPHVKVVLKVSNNYVKVMLFSSENSIL